MKRRPKQPKAARQANNSSFLFFLCEEEKKMNWRRGSSEAILLVGYGWAEPKATSRKRKRALPNFSLFLFHQLNLILFQYFLSSLPFISKEMKRERAAVAGII